MFAVRNRAIGLLVAGLLAAAAPVPDGYRLDNYRGEVPDQVPGGTVVHPGDLRALVDHGGAVLIDVLPSPRRPPEMRADEPWMPVAHKDIPGSVWLPDVGRGALSDAMAAWFASQLAILSGGDVDRTLVFYCQANCWMSWNAAKRAASLGYHHVVWFPEGVDGWGAAGLPLTVATPRLPP